MFRVATWAEAAAPLSRRSVAAEAANLDARELMRWIPPDCSTMTIGWQVRVFNDCDVSGHEGRARPACDTPYPSATHRPRRMVIMSQHGLGEGDRTNP